MTQEHACLTSWLLSTGAFEIVCTQDRTGYACASLRRQMRPSTLTPQFATNFATRPVVSGSALCAETAPTELFHALGVPDARGPAAYELLKAALGARTKAWHGRQRERARVGPATLAKGSKRPDTPTVLDRAILNISWGVFSS